MRYLTNNEITFNTRIKHFPLASMTKITFASKPIFKEKGWECTRNKKTPKPQTKGNKSRSDSIYRALNNFRDISLLNNFDYFITWTLDSSKISRTDIPQIMKKLQKFLNNLTQRNNAKYILIPEYHKDKEAIHIHGLISGNFDLVDSGTRTKDNKIIYNMRNWKYGYSTVIQLTGNKERYTNYITKYITKGLNKIFGHFYYAGGKLNRVAETHLCNCNYLAIDAPEYHVKEAQISFKYQDIKEDFQ